MQYSHKERVRVMIQTMTTTFITKNLVPQQGKSVENTR